MPSLDEQGFEPDVGLPMILPPAAPDRDPRVNVPVPGANRISGREPERVLAPAPKNHERRHLTNQRDGFAIKNAARQLCQVYVCTGNVVEPRVMVNYREQLKLAAIISKPQTYKASNEPKV